jgi:hypothetical protein
MVLSEVFERFIQGSPVAVMARVLMERALEPSVLDRLFRKAATKQYEKELLFSSLVNLMALVVCGIRPTVRTAYAAMRKQLPVTLTALYGKLNRVEVGTCQALVAESAQRFRPVIEALGPIDAWVPGYRVKVLDGNHIASTEHRLEVLRDCAAGPLPGQSLVVLEPETGLATQMVGCEDGHAQERSLLEPVLAAVEPKDLYIADRNFCTLGFLIGIAKRGGFFVIRHHANMPLTSLGILRPRGRIESGEVLEQTVTLKLGEEKLKARRIVLRLDTPTRDGDTEMSIVTNLPSRVANAAAVAGLYARRWTVESLFARVERNLQSELGTLAYPGAALFVFAVALVASNVFAVVHAAMTAAQKTTDSPKIAAMPLSHFAIVEEIRTAHRGMDIALSEECWEPLRSMAPAPLAKLLLQWTRHIDWDAFRKSVRGPKLPRTERTRFRDKPHVSTARLLGRA